MFIRYNQRLGGQSLKIVHEAWKHDMRFPLGLGLLYYISSKLPKIEMQYVICFATRIWKCAYSKENELLVMREGCHQLEENNVISQQSVPYPWQITKLKTLGCVWNNDMLFQKGFSFQKVIFLSSMFLVWGKLRGVAVVHDMVRMSSN